MPIACSLDQGELRDRASLMASLGGDLSAIEAHGLRALLRFKV
jgi:hypothetical protein